VFRSSGELVKNAEATDGGICSIREIFKGKFTKAVGSEGRKFFAGKGPWQLAWRVGESAARGDQKKLAARTEKICDSLDGRDARRRRQGLQRVNLDNEVEALAPFSRWSEKICCEMFEGGAMRAGPVREALLGRANGRFGNIESGDAKAERGEMIGVIAKAAADYQRGFSGGCDGMGFEKVEEIAIGTKVGPGDDAPAFGSLAIERFEPAGRVTFLIEFGGEFAGAGTVGHGSKEILA
jgi:hypothetical protein